MARDDVIERYTSGYMAENRRGMWERVALYGAPRKVAACWLSLCVLGGFLLAVYVKFLLLFLVAGLWIAGHIVMVALTYYDPDWPDVLTAQGLWRYADYYDAG
jgi:type IV secretory pathway TrbD component